MKYKLFTTITFCLAVLSFNSVAQRGPASNWTVINAYGKILSIGKVARPGKISVFIVSTYWCPPCKALKKNLQQQTGSQMANVDFYDIQMATDQDGKNYSYADLKTTIAYRMWRQLELLKEWPLIYITSPTTNVVKKFSPGDLTSGSALGKILEVIQKLQQPSQGFHEEYLVQEATYVEPPSDQKQQLPNWSNNSKTYLVKPGDTLHKIARMFGTKCKRIIKLNGIIDPDKIAPGQVLVISK